MTKHRGRPSQSLREHILKQDAEQIANHFIKYPLRQPIDPNFDPYYTRILNRDLAAVWEYSLGKIWLEGSFYELIGRLVPLQSIAAAEQIISKVRRGDANFDFAGSGSLALPDLVIYQDWYEKLRIHCKIARQFIRDRYKMAPLSKRAELWNEYCDKYFFPLPASRGLRSCPKTPANIKACGEIEYDNCGQTPHRRDDALWNLVELFLRHHLVPRPVFFDLAVSERRADVRAERDARFRNRRFTWTSSSIARKYACAIVGISPSSVSHKK